MKLHHALLAAVAVGALIAPNANAATKKHVRHHAAAAPKDGALKSEVEALKAEVAALREEIKAQRASTAATQTEVASLQTQTSTAAQTASAAQQTATTAVAKADTAVAKAEAVKTAEAAVEKKAGAMAWAGDTKVGGTVFFNVSNINQQSNAGAGPVKLANRGTGVNLKRLYLTVDHKFSDVWSANITADVSNVIGETNNNNYATPSANTTTGAISSIGEVGKGFYIKKAYLQAKLDRALVLRVGATDTAWVPYLEGIYGHRYIENEFVDEYKIGTSADWGVTATGELADGLISYHVGVVNGAGYRNVEVSNSVDLDGRLSAQYKGFFAAIGGYRGRLGKNIQPTTLAHAATRFDGAFGYKSDLFTVGGEYAYAKDFASVVASATNFEDKNEGWSVFANYNFMPKWQVFGRYDWIRQTNNLTTNTSVKNEYYNFGVQWEVAKTVDLSLVYKRAQATNFGTAAGTIAWQEGTGSIGGAVGGTYDEVGLFGLIKF